MLSQEEEPVMDHCLVLQILPLLNDNCGCFFPGLDCTFCLGEDRVRKDSHLFRPLDPQELML